MIVGWLGGRFPDTHAILMDQYHPAWKAKDRPEFAEINRCVTASEMDAAFAPARAAALWRFDTRWRRSPPGHALRAALGEAIATARPPRGAVVFASRRRYHGYCQARIPRLHEQAGRFSPPH